MDAEPEVRARVSADIEAPDRIVWGLTARQVAILAAAAALGYLAFTSVGDLVQMPVLVPLLMPFAGIAVALAVGRRDGLSLDAWLWASLRHQRTPRHVVPALTRVHGSPAWAPMARTAGPQLGLLRLPARAISDAGVIDLGDAATVLVAATTVNVGLRTGAEQAALVGSYARWLNSLTGPVQVVISARRVDLTGHALHIADAADTLPHPALADAALDYSDFLLDVAAQRDPLWRTVTIACTAASEGNAGAEAMRRAEHTAGSLATLGAQTRVLDGTTATAVLTTAVDPYQPTDDSWPRTPAHRAVTAHRPLEAAE